MTASLVRDRLTRRLWLHFPNKPAPAVIATLRACGWRWGGYRKAWYHPSTQAVPPASIPFTDDGECDYSAERSERLEARAHAAHDRASAAHVRSHAILGHIPLGQPILVGHHSERRHRRALERADTAMQAFVTEQRTADDLRSRAEASRRHQAHLEAPGTIARRLDKLRAQLRRIERAAGGARNGAWSANQIAAVSAEIARNEQLLADAGGLLADGLQVLAGDLIRIKGWTVRVSRVNPRSFSGVIVGGGADGMTGKWDRSHLQAILERQGKPFAPSPPGPVSDP